MRLLALLLLIAGCASTAPSPAARDIDRFVDGLLQAAPEVPSLGIAVVQDGRVVYLREAHTPYYVASTTKAYTGLACAILAARGQLDLDAPVTKYLPEVTLQSPPTLRAFLSHTSGIRNDAIAFRTAFSGEHTPEQLVRLLNDSKTIPAGFHYDNLGYVVASLVLERVTGKPWQIVLRDLVFAPLGMEHTTAFMSEAQRWNMPTPYLVDDKAQLQPVTLRKTDATMHAAGGVVTTPEDLARWLNANIAKEGGGIPRAAFDEAEKIQAATTTDRFIFKTRGYGFGWYVGSLEGETALEHGGGFAGWQSLFSFLPDRKIGIGIMSNASGPSLRAMVLVTSYIYDRLLGKPVDGAARLADITAQLTKARAAMLADAAKRAQRPWMLKHPNEVYTGRYVNPAFGTMTIATEGGRLVASLANLHAVLEPYVQPESARVELVPDQGEVLRFIFDSVDRPASMKWGDDVFTRAD